MIKESRERNIALITKKASKRNHLWDKEDIARNKYGILQDSTCTPDLPIERLLGETLQQYLQRLLELL